MTPLRDGGGSERDPLAKGSAARVTMRDGELAMWRPAPTMLVTRIEGVLGEVGAEAIALEMVRVLHADKRLLVMHDWEAMTQLPASAVARMQAAAVDAHEGLEAVHFVMPVRPGLFGVQAAGALRRPLTFHPTRGAFERRVREEALARWVQLASGVRVRPPIPK